MLKNFQGTAIVVSRGQADTSKFYIFVRFLNVCDSQENATVTDMDIVLYNSVLLEGF